MSRRIVLLTWMVCFVLAGSARAEVGMPFGDPQTGARTHGPLISIIGDAPDPFPNVWRRLLFPDSNFVPLNPEGTTQGDGVPSVVQNPVTEESIVAWARNSPTGFDVVVSRFASGEWSDPDVVAGGTGDQIDPWLLVGGDGTVHLVYGTGAPDRAVWYQAAPPDLSSWSPPLRVSETSVAASRPTAVIHQGVLRVVFEAHDLGFGMTPKTIVVSRLDAGVFSREVIAITANPGEAAPRIGSHEGRLWIDWVDVVHATGDGELAWVRLNQQGPEPTAYISFTSIFDREFHVRPGIRLLVLEP